MISYFDFWSLYSGGGGRGGGREEMRGRRRKWRREVGEFGRIGKSEV